jgi:Protein of unknown function (DUF3311)
MPTKRRTAARFWRVLLLVPVLAVLAVPIFDRTAPALWGFPFFYWYQMFWVVLCSGAVGLVFLLEDPGGQAEDDA